MTVACNSHGGNSSKHFTYRKTLLGGVPVKKTPCICDNFDLFVKKFHNIYKSSMPSSLISTLLQECLMLMFMFVFIQVNFIQETKFFNATPSLHVHLIIMIQFVCHFHIGCKTIFQLKFKFKFVFTQAFLIF